MYILEKDRSAFLAPGLVQDGLEDGRQEVWSRSAVWLREHSFLSPPEVINQRITWRSAVCPGIDTGLEGSNASSQLLRTRLELSPPALGNVILIIEQLD